MKKLIIITLLILSTNLYAQELIDKSKMERFNLKHYEVEYTQEGTIDKETGYLRINSAENYKSKEQDAKNIAWDYLKNKLQLYGLTDLSEFRIRKVAESLTGEFVYFDQYINDIPVYQTNFTIFIDKEKHVRFVSNEFRNISKNTKDILAASLLKSIKINEAIEIAKKHLNILETSNMIGKPGGFLTYLETKNNEILLTWGINIACLKPEGNWYIFIDALNEQIVHIEDQTDHGTTFVDIPALIHNPNPLVTKRVNSGDGSPYNRSYVGGNWDNPTLNAAREQVMLRSVPHTVNLYPNGTGWNFYYIGEGPYCKLDEREPPTTQNWVQFDGWNFSIVDYKRHQPEFASIMCYYHIDKSARRVMELGYNIDNTGLKGLVVDPHGSGTYFRRREDTLLGIPIGNWYTYIAFQDLPEISTWEDADAIWHEHAHAIQYHFGAGLAVGEEIWEHGAVKNGCSDYWTISNRLPISDYKWTKFGIWAWEREAINYGLKYPRDFDFNNGFEHKNGRIFASALMKIQENIAAETNTAIGKDITDKLFLEMHFRWSNITNCYNAAYAFLESSKYLYDGQFYCKIFNTLQEFGLVVNTTHWMTINYTSNASIISNDVIIQNAKITNGAKVTIKACNEIIIDNNFEVGANSQLEIHCQVNNP